MTSRIALIRIHRRFVRDLKREIGAIQGRATASFARYAREYRRDFRVISRPITTGQLARRVARARIVYVGDFHTLKPAQLTVIKMMKEAIRGGRRPVLLVEMIRARDQGALSAFLDLEIFEDEFLRRIRYRRSWGFDWSHYKNLFYFAMAHQIPVIGLNDDRPGTSSSLRARDAFAARLIADAAETHPDSPLFVLYGDHHVATAHLPAAADRELARRKRRATRVVIHQNNESIYWRLAERGVADDVRAVELERDVFCLINSTPLVLYQSYLDWTENSHAMEGSSSLDLRVAEPRVDTEAHARRMLGVLVHFFKIPADGLDNFTVYDGGQLDFLQRLSERHGFTQRDLRILGRELRTARNYFIPKGSVLYLTTLSVNRTAEAVSHLVHTLCSGDRERPRDVRGDFYYRVVREALGFLGSKIVNPKRVARGLADYRSIVSSPLAKDAPPGERDSWLVAQAILDHELKIARHRSRGTLPRASLALFRTPADRRWDVAAGIGQLLGEGIYRGLVAEHLTREEVRSLFFVPCPSADLAFGAYRRLWLFARKARRR